MTTDRDALNTIIREEIIQQGGFLPFDRFMTLALYHPQYGYYHANILDIGQHGDFTTAPEISPLFARCFAPPTRQVLDLMGTNHVLELGAGTGRFAGDLLRELDKAGKQTQYAIYEISPSLRKKQQLLLASEYPDIVDHVSWLDYLPKSFKGVVIANEVLDALPVARFRIREDGIEECGVAWENNQFIWKSRQSPCTNLDEAANRLRQMYALYDGYESEINLELPRFIQSLADPLTAGVILFSDYGYGQREYYHPERNRGTITCFYQHHHHSNPLAHPGQQDITAHVDFTSVIDTAVDYGCRLLGYTSQAAFLLDNGLASLIEEAKETLSAKDTLRLLNAAKLLTLPTEMGERVKVMALGKNIEIELRGFNGADRRREL